MTGAVATARRYFTVVTAERESWTRPMPVPTLSPARVYWTAFIGLFFDYYDLFLFIYLEKVLAAHFSLSAAESSALQFTGLAGVGLGALIFGYLADRFGRGRVMLAVFGVYLVGVAGLSLAGNYPCLLVFRLLASLALGAEWGISHTFLNEQVGPQEARGMPEVGDSDNGAISLRPKCSSI